MQSSVSSRIDRRWSRGGAAKDVLVFLFVVALLALAAWALLHFRADKPQKPANNATSATTVTDSSATTASRPAPSPMAQDSSVHYLCRTSEHNVPIKAVISARDGAKVYERADITAATSQTLPSFSTWFVFDENQGFLQVGPSSLSPTTTGWIRKEDMIRWMTREALQPIPERVETSPLYLWENEEEIGDADKWSLQQRNPRQLPHDPILEANGDRYKVAVTYLATDGSDYGVTSAWTDHVHEGEEVKIFYQQTKEDLADIIEKTRASLLDITAGDHSEQPLVRFLREKARLTVGSAGLDTKSDNFGFWMKTLEELRVPLSSMRPQPADIQAKTAVYKDRLDRMLAFYQDASNWNERGEGWLPKEIAPVE